MPPLTSSMTELIFAGVFGYLIGAIPFGILIAKVLGLGNLREIGSGNIGATNVLRTGSKVAALLTVICDMGKGVVAVLVARAIWGEDASHLAGLAAFLGHLYPIWLGFRGGKGVATFLGVFLAVNPFVGLACCGVWLFAALVMRMSSLAALISVAICPVWMLFFGHAEMLLLGFVVTIFVYIKHLPNIKRIKNGTEPKIGEAR